MSDSDSGRKCATTMMKDGAGTGPLVELPTSHPQSIAFFHVALLPFLVLWSVVNTFETNLSHLISDCTSSSRALLPSSSSSSFPKYYSLTALSPLIENPYLHSDLPFNVPNITTPPIRSPTRSHSPHFTIIDTRPFLSLTQILEEESIPFAVAIWRAIVYESIASTEGLDTTGTMVDDP